MGFFSLYARIILTLPFTGFYILISIIIRTKSYPERETSRQNGYVLTQIMFLILLLGFAVLFASNVIYVIAPFYNSKDITYKKKVICVLRKCWERLIFAIFWGFLIGATYTHVALGLILWFFKGVDDDLTLPDPYYAGFNYMVVVLMVTTIVTLLEMDDGIKALAEHVGLIFGKKWISCVVHGLLEIVFTGIVLPFCYLVVYGNQMNLVVKVFVRIGCFFFTIIWIHLSLVRLAVVYVVSKSCLNQDMPTAPAHAEVVPVIPLDGEKDVQLE